MGLGLPMGNSGPTTTTTQPKQQEPTPTTTTTPPPPTYHGVPDPMVLINGVQPTGANPVGTKQPNQLPIDSNPNPTNVNPTKGWDTTGYYERGGLYYPTSYSQGNYSYPRGFTPTTVKGVTAEEADMANKIAGWKNVFNTQMEPYRQDILDQLANLDTQKTFYDKRRRLDEADLRFDTRQKMKELNLKLDSIAQNRGWNDEVLAMAKRDMLDQLAHLGNLDALSQRGLKQTLSYVNRGRELSGQKRDLTMQYLTGQDQFAQMQYGITSGELGLQRDIGNRNQISDATVRGAIWSEGHGDRMGDIAQQWQLGMDQAGLTRDRALADNSYGRSNAELEYKGDINSYDNQANRAKLNRDTDKENYRYSKQQAQQGYDDTQKRVAHENAQLDNMAAQYGVDKATFRRQLRIGLQRMGIDYAEFLDSLSSQRSSLNKNMGFIPAQIDAMVRMAIQ